MQPKVATLMACSGGLIVFAFVFWGWGFGQILEPFVEESPFKVG